MTFKPLPPTTIIPPLGERPVLMWIDKKLLLADHRYQRGAEGAGSVALIKKIAANFSWLHCGTLVVVHSGEDYAVIDGQHRLAAAMRRRDIKDLPCSVSAQMTVAQQASAFVTLNRDRVPLNQLNIFWAAVAAGNADECAVRDACVRAKVKLLRYPKPWLTIAPNETYVTGILLQLERATKISRTAPSVFEVLYLIRTAYPDRPGQLTAAMIGLVARALARGAPPAQLTDVLRTTSASRLAITARVMREADPALKIAPALDQAVARMLATHAGVVVPVRAAVGA